MTRILIIDDHTLFRDSLSRLLDAEPGFSIVGAFSTVSDAIESPATKHADLVLLDFDLGDGQGTVFLDQAKTIGFRGKVLLVTAGMSDGDIIRALETGASGLFLKHSPPGQLVQAIHNVMNGEEWMDPRALQTLAAAANTPRPAPSAASTQTLTAREQAVLNGIFEGLTNKEIGGKLDISESSVKAAIQQLFDKTGVRTRSQLVRIALERHLNQ